jgi:type IV secretory pathway TraG/TraD family ATPase VirD4
LGDALFRGEMRPVYMTDEDRRRHLYIVGQTGTGKSTLIGNLVMEDIRSGKGLAIIDPHGELVENALGFVPKERLDDVIYFNAGDLTRPMGMNMLDYNFDRPEEKTFIVNEMINIFDKLYDLKTTGGPMFEQYMRNALLLMMEDMPNEPATLIEVPRIFSDPAYRARKLARIKNPVVVDFWEKEATKAGGEASLANMTPYITSKFTSFISNDYMRPIVGQPKSAFNFREVMDSGKILLVNLSKGRIGDLNAQLLGLIITGKMLMAALSRADIAEGADRRDFYLYIDEFQNFATDSISTILSEARKYRLDLIVAHQFIAQLTEKIRDSVFGNVGSILAFRVGPQDAEFLEKQFEPVFTRQDLVNIDNLKAYARLLIDGQTSRAFVMKVGTASWRGGDKDIAQKMKEYSRTKYGEDRQVVEEGIYRRLRG